MGLDDVKRSGSPVQTRIWRCMNGHIQNRRNANCEICGAPIDWLGETNPSSGEHDEQSANTLGFTPLSAPTTDISSNSVAEPISSNEVRGNSQIVRSGRAVVLDNTPREQGDINVRRRTALTPQNEAQINTPDKTRVQSKLVSSDFQLDYFGEKISIPPEGGWIGRSELGRDCFEGNLLISRRHVFIKPVSSNTVEFGPDSSLNGAFYCNDGKKTRLGQNEKVEIAASGIVWLYNIPLKLERRG